MKNPQAEARLFAALAVIVEHCRAAAEHGVRGWSVTDPDGEVWDVACVRDSLLTIADDDDDDDDAVSDDDDAAGGGEE